MFNGRLEFMLLSNDFTDILTIDRVMEAIPQTIPRYSKLSLLGINMLVKHFLMLHLDMEYSLYHGFKGNWSLCIVCMKKQTPDPSTENIMVHTFRYYK